MLASGAYFVLVLTLGEIARRKLGVSADITRKSVLASLSAWIVPAVYLFDEPRKAAATFLLLAAALYFSFRFEILKAMEDEGPSLGSVLAPVSMALLLVWLGDDRAHLVVAATLASGLGDGAAAIIGRRLGTRKVRFYGNTRTMEGALAYFLASSGVMAPVLALMGGLDWHQAVAFALIAGTVAATVEAVSIYGADNFTVPIAVAATLVFLTRASAH